MPGGAYPQQQQQPGFNGVTWEAPVLVIGPMVSDPNPAPAPLTGKTVAPNLQGAGKLSSVVR